MRINKIISAFLLVITGLPALAQDDLTKTVQVTRAYDPIISDADKIGFSPEGYDTLLNFRNKYQYSVIQQSMQPGSALRPISAAKISGKNYEDPQWIYARLGAGYPLRFLGDLYVNNIKPDDLSVGLFYNNRSIWAKVNNGDRDVPVDEMNHGGGVYLRKHWEALTLGVEGGFHGHNLLLYGCNPHKITNVTLNKEDLKRSYISYYVNAGVKSNDSDLAKFRYRIDLYADIYGDNGDSRFKIDSYGKEIFSQQENSFGAKGFLGKAFSEGAHLIGLDFGGTVYLRNLQYNKYYNDVTIFPDRAIFGELYRKLYGNNAGRDSSDTRLIFTAQPSYTFSLNRLKLQVGVKYTGYDAGNGFKSKIYPVVDFAFRAANEFIPFACMDGGMEMNNYKAISAENPYIQAGMNMAMKPTNRSYSIAAGARGAIANVFSYNIYGKYSLYEDLYFFKNEPVYYFENSFNVVYDKVQQWKAGVEMGLTLGAVRASLSGAYFSYILDKLDAPYHRPSLVGDFDISVNASKNLIFNLALHAQDCSPYTYVNSNVNFISYNKAFFDLGIGAEYLFNRSFSVFAVANNLLNQKYEKWHQYKVPGIGALVGLTVKF